MKKFVSLLLALVMVLAMGATAFAASITINPPSMENGTSTLITYTAYKIFDATIAGESVAYTIESTSPYYEAVLTSGYFTLTQAAGSETTYVVAAKDTYTAAVADTFADTLKAIEATAAGTATTTSGAAATITDLTDGYYLVTSTVGSDLILDTIGEITVNTKNEYPGLDKKVEGKDDYTTADKGEVIEFTIAVTIPADAVGEIVVHDKMSGLEYQSMTAVEGITETKTLEDGCAVHFTLTADYVAANKGTTVTITYTAKVTADVANNESWLVDGDYTSKPDETKVYSTDVVINKVIGGTTTPLAGAEFVLKNSENKYYKVDENGNVTWVAAQSDATKVTTGEDGKAEFTDIADGTYYLVETKAPTGYNLLTAPVEVKVEAKLDNAGAVIDIVAEVENNAGTELPSTGGMGTTMMYIGGGLLVAFAVIMLVTKRRMNAAE